MHFFFLLGVSLKYSSVFPTFVSSMMSTKSFFLCGAVSVSPCRLIRARRFWTTSLVNLQTQHRYQVCDEISQTSDSVPCFFLLCFKLLFFYCLLLYFFSAGTCARCLRPSWIVSPAPFSSKSSHSGVKSFGVDLLSGRSAPRWPTRTRWSTWRENIFLKKWKNGKEEDIFVVHSKDGALTAGSCCCSWRHISADCPGSSEWPGRTSPW